MNTEAQVAEALRRIVLHPTGGVVGLVDELLAACHEHRLQLDWQGGRCRVRSGAWETAIDLPLRASVFRAVLARLAALADPDGLGSVSPYGGEGEIRLGRDPRWCFRLQFTNTPAEQKLALTTETVAAPRAEGVPRAG